MKKEYKIYWHKGFKTQSFTKKTFVILCALVSWRQFIYPEYFIPFNSGIKN